MHIHILGICGTLMGSIALLAREAGHRVSGTDQNVYPPMSTQLADAGIQLTSPYSEECIPTDTDLVIVGNAGLPRGNPAVETVLNRRLPYVSGAQWLGQQLLTERWVIAISGTHGKTTTASMVAWILEYAGLKPGYLIGGIPSNFGQSAALGNEPFFVIEADEYDTSYFDRQSKFLHYSPQTLVINNLEFDHADIFENLQAIQNQFHLLLRRIPGNGMVIHPKNDRHVHEVIDRGCWTPTQTFDLNNADFCAQDVVPDGSEFSICVSEKIVGRITWSLTGMHNVQNALAAIAAARHAGVQPSVACSALSEFTGVKRRLELIHSDDNLSIYDDFAHHPTAIQSTLTGLRAKIGTDTLLAVIEPASHTMRLGIHATTLANAISSADHTMWFNPANINWDMRQHLSGTASEIINDTDLLLSRCKDFIEKHQLLHVVIMSNGGFNGFHEKLIAVL
jgi:UDP-N-acetylmuramate: L-alanyl-gamma-D-glutamyl-meso-diaminopimelate ligase|tara:strand:- start:266 stop:1618 length:1353 start_codon:yes stop_codon:yes gene_type:complete